jgi:hypothetical protein
MLWPSLAERHNSTKIIVNIAFFDYKNLCFKKAMFNKILPLKRRKEKEEKQSSTRPETAEQSMRLSGKKVKETKVNEYARKPGTII